MRAYLTGGLGFAGTWLTRHLREMGDEVTLSPQGLDVTDAPALAADIALGAPDVIYHLAALTHVGRSWEDPAETLRVNALGTLAVLEAAAALGRPPRVVLVSSCEVYGHGTGSPLTEAAPLAPVSPYAASKVAAEFLGVQAFLGRGLPVIIVRPFNHIGAGQSSDFVVPALARRIVEVERTGGGAVRVGNLAARRDFTDVRDMVRAYRVLAEEGMPGTVYNVCSGSAVEIAEIARALGSFALVPVEFVTDPALLRPVDVPLVVGEGSRIAAGTGWKPEIPLETTLADVLEDWRNRPT